MRNLGHVVVSLGLGLAVLAGCEQKGPMEKAGKEIQKAGEKAPDKLRDATK